jgi:hypothetical protein
MKTRKIKTSAKEGQEKRDKKIVSLFFSMLEEKGMTLEEFNAPKKKNKRGIAMPTYEAIAEMMGISEFTVLRVLQRNGYVPKRKYILVEDEVPFQQPPTVTP